MVRYIPLLADGQRVKLSWPVRLFRLNHIFWPLDESTTYMWRLFDYLMALLGSVLLFMHNDAELRYLWRNANNLDLLLTGVPTYLILVEGQLRGAHVLLHRRQFRVVLEKFYSTIYVDPRKNLQTYREIEKNLVVNRVVSALYVSVVMGYVIAPILMLIHQKKDFLYSMTPPFNTEPLYVFVPLILSGVWVGLYIDSMVLGEIALQCELMAHLTGRYQLLQHELDKSMDCILRVRNRPLMAQQMQHLLVHTLRQNVILSRFGAQLEDHFTVRIFIMFGFSALLLCALAFKTYVSPSGNYIYPCWFGAKTVELLSLGRLGNDLAHMTNMQSSMYYLSRWEEVIYYSTNPLESVRLLKLIALAIEVNYKPFYLTGLSYFQVSIQTVLKILQGAFSYFTFLTSMRSSS